MLLHKMLSESSLGTTGNTVFTLPWESRALRPGEGSPEPLPLHPPGAWEGDVDGKRYVRVFVHECLVERLLLRFVIR